MSLFLEIQGLLGDEVCQWLRSQFAGRTIRIPESIHPGHPLAPLGQRAEELSYFYGGSFVWIPKGRFEIVSLRDSCLYRDAEKGESVDALALKYSMSRRNVFKRLQYKRAEKICNSKNSKMEKSSDLGLSSLAQKNA
jgi:Mor transcription activator family